MTTLKEYYTKYDKFLKDEITENEWIQYTEKNFNKILKENEGMFKRLKNEWAE